MRNVRGGSLFRKFRARDRRAPTASRSRHHPRLRNHAGALRASQRDAPAENICLSGGSCVLESRRQSSPTTSRGGIAKSSTRTSYLRTPANRFVVVALYRAVHKHYKLGSAATPSGQTRRRLILSAPEGRLAGAPIDDRADPAYGRHAGHPSLTPPRYLASYHSRGLLQLSLECFVRYDNPPRCPNLRLAELSRSGKL